MRNGPLTRRQMVDTLDSICKDCFRCVQNCPNRLIEKGLQPCVEGRRATTTGRPRSSRTCGSRRRQGGYPCPAQATAALFRGPASTPCGRTCRRSSARRRDGIHGREYISTTVDLGRKVRALTFGKGNGQCPIRSHPLVELPAACDLRPPSLLAAGTDGDPRNTGRRPHS